ncbi:MAG: glucokinase [Thermoflexales bacterium]|nr:glucokinase [Thermoflexales bacterium]
MLLAGDIGGTKTELALFSPEQSVHHILRKKTFSSRAYLSLEAIVSEFLSGKDIAVTGASFGVAGPVVGERAQITNLPWVVDTRILSDTLGGVPVHLLNDLEAIAYALPFLQPTDLDVLNPGQPEEHGTLSVVAPGTGLGEAFLVWNGQQYRAYPSEGGHSNFGPNTPLELELLGYLQKRFDHVSYERVCSGQAVPNLYAFFKDSGRWSEPDWLREQLATATDLTPIIVQAALAKQAEICVATLELFVSILASEASDVALKVLATGGLYLGGGIPPRILPRLKDKTFMEAFTRKGRFSQMLSRIPVYVILNPNAALIGAACHSLGLK